MKDLVCEIGQEITDIRSSFSLEKRAKGQSKELSPIKVR